MMAQSNKPLPSSNPKTGMCLINADSRAKRYYFYGLILILFLLGVYLSIVLWGNTPVPHADTPHFNKVGHELLNFQLPSRFKRGPVVGLLQAALSHVILTDTPDIHAGWLVNALLYPFIPVLVFLIGKRFIDHFTFFPAILFTLNPWQLVRLTEGIAEIPFVFFVLLSVWLLYRRSPWAYAAAMLASMTRYEGAILIGAAFILDMVYPLSVSYSRRRAFIYTVLAFVPLALWMLGTVVYWNPNDTNYLHFVDFKPAVFLDILKLVWETSTAVLCYFPRQQSAMTVVNVISQILTALLVILGISWGLLKHRRETLVLVIFIVGYLSIHSMYGFHNHRFYAPIAWVILLFVFYAVSELWRYLGRRRFFMKVLSPVLQMVVMLVGLVGIRHLHAFTLKLNVFCPRLAMVPILLVAICLITFTIRLFILRAQGGLLVWATLSSITLFMVLSNHYAAASSLVGSESRDIEFKLFIDWYLQHAEQGEKVMLTLPEPMELLAPEMRGLLFHAGHTDEAVTFESFTRYCLDHGITYVVWDSRIGYASHDTYYKLWHIEKMTPLAYGRTTEVNDVPLDEPTAAGRGSFAVYQYLTTLGRSPRFIHIYRLVQQKR